MEYPFPGPNLPLYSSKLFWTMQLVLLAMTILSTEIFFHGVRNGPKRWHVPICIILILAVPFAVIALIRVQGDLQIAQIFGWAIAIMSLAALTNWERWQRFREKKPAWGVTVFICLVVVLGIAPRFLPEVAHVRPVAERADCANRMRQAALAMHTFHDKFKRFPDLTISEGSDAPRSWRVEVLPYLEGSQLRDQYQDKNRWDSSENTSVAKTRFAGYGCPSNPYETDIEKRYYTHIAAVTGAKTCFENGRGRSLDEIGDGDSNTILLIEAAGKQIVWTEPRDIDIDKDPPGFNLPGNRPHTSPGWGSSYHKAGVNAVYADGSVRALPLTTDNEVVRRLMTANGGESNDDDYLDR